MSCPRNKHMFRRRSVGCFSRRERRAYLESIRKERATRKNSQLNTAQRVAMKMGRRLRCSSVTYPLRYAPSTASPARTALPAAPFDTQQTHAYFGDRTRDPVRAAGRDATAIGRDAVRAVARDAVRRAVITPIWL